MNTQERKTGVALLSVVSNSTLVLLKIIVGLSIGSVSVISEAIHSGVDLLASVIAFFAVKKSGKPADREHPFGHGKIENISGTIEALLIFVAAGWIIIEAVRKLIHSEPLIAAGWGIAVMVFSALANVVVSQMLFRVGRETDSVALIADAWHLRTDVYTSCGVVVALGVIWIGARAMPHMNLYWVDPAAAIGVALLIIKAACQLTRESIRDLVDTSLPEEVEAWIYGYLSTHGEAVRGFHRLRTRKAGSKSFVEFHLMVDAKMTVEDSHQIADAIEHALKEHLKDAVVTIHVEPCNGDCTPTCLQECFLTESERWLIKRSR